MEQQEIKILKLFEALCENGSQSQRELSKNLDISLGLTNTLLKKAIKNGFLKIVAADNNKIKYMLTPKGMTEKGYLTYRYINHLIKYYDETRKMFKSIFNKIEELNMKKVILAGISELSEIAYVVAKESNVDLIGIVDDNEIRSVFLDLPLLKRSLINNTNCDAILITDIKNTSKVKNSFKNFGLSNEKIFELI